MDEEERLSRQHRSTRRPASGSPTSMRARPRIGTRSPRVIRRRPRRVATLNTPPETERDFLDRNQLALEYELTSPKIKSFSLRFLKVKVTLSGKFALQNRTQNPDFRIVLNQRTIEQTIDRRLNAVMTRRLFSSWEEALIYNVGRNIPRQIRAERNQEPFDLESALVESATIPDFLVGQVGNFEWQVGLNPTLRLVPPTLSLYVLTARYALLDHSFGEVNVGGVPIELRLNGGVNFSFGISKGGWGAVFKFVIRQLGLESALATLRAIAIQLGITLLVTYGVTYVFSIAIRQAQREGWEMAMALAYTGGFTRIIWSEDVGAGPPRRDVQTAFQKGVDDALELIGTNMVNPSTAAFHTVRQEIQQHLVRATFAGRNVNSVNRSDVAYQLALRLLNGSGIPNPSANLPF